MSDGDESNSLLWVQGPLAKDGLTEAVRDLNLTSVRNSKIALTDDRVNECVALWQNDIASTQVIVSENPLPELQTMLLDKSSVTSTGSASPMQPLKRKRGEENSILALPKPNEKPQRTVSIPCRTNKVTFVLQNNPAGENTPPEDLSDTASQSSASEAEMQQGPSNDDNGAESLTVSNTVTVITTPTNEVVEQPRPRLTPFVPPTAQGVTEKTQTQDPDDEYKVIERAEQLWLLMKKHRSYEQRAKLRGLLIKNLLENDITPIWAIRRDHEPRPQYIQYSPAMLALTKRHARELSQLAYTELFATSRQEKERADEFQEITEAIYVRENDNNYNKAANRCAAIISKYRTQEKNKLDSARTRDMDMYPDDDEAYKTLLEQQPRASTSRRQTSRSESRENKRRRQASQGPSAPPPPPPPPPPPQSGSSVAQASGKGKAGPNSHTKGSSKRGGRQELSFAGSSGVNQQRPAPNPTPQHSREVSPQSRGRTQYRGQRGGRGGRGSNRGRGRGGYENQQRDRRPQNNNSDEDFISKLKGILKKFE